MVCHRDVQWGALPYARSMIDFTLINSFAVMSRPSCLGEVLTGQIGVGLTLFVGPGVRKYDYNNRSGVRISCYNPFSNSFTMFFIGLCRPQDCESR